MCLNGFMDFSLKNLSGSCKAQFFKACGAGKYKLQKAANNGAYKIAGKAPFFKWEQPARDFEGEYEITGISRQYKMPNDQTEREIAKITKFDKASLNINITRNLLDDLIKLNPELQKISYDPNDCSHTSNIIDGITSGFNPNDINYFIRTNTPTINGLRSEEQTLRFLTKMAYEEKLNVSTSMMPSPETWETIQQKLKKSKNWKPTQESLQIQLGKELEAKLDWKTMYNPAYNPDAKLKPIYPKPSSQKNDHDFY